MKPLFDALRPDEYCTAQVYCDHMERNVRQSNRSIRFVDLFCGIGGFRLAALNTCLEKGLIPDCVFSSDIDAECRNTYATNFGHIPAGDITQVATRDIPKHDLLLAGFPCQPFSIIGHMKGFEDTRGTLFFEIARILEELKPAAFVLENVKLLVGHNKGRTLQRILETLRNLGYQVDFKVLNALDFGLPQKRERVFIVGTESKIEFRWPDKIVPMKPLSEVLEKNVPRKFYASDRIRENRWKALKPKRELTIWHENKAGHISAYPYSCALRAGASYNYLLVNGERRLTPREMLRLQGFPDTFKAGNSDSQTRKQAGNSLPVPMAQAVVSQLFDALNWSGNGSKTYPNGEAKLHQIILMEKGEYKYGRTSSKKC